MPETAKKFFSNKLAKQVGEKGSGGGGKGSSDKQPSPENNKGKEPLFGDTIDLISDDSSSESENAALGTKGTPSSPQHCDAPGVQIHRKAFVTDGDACGTSSSRPRRKVVNGDLKDSTSPAATANGSAPKVLIWKYDDEMCLLSAMARFTNLLGYYPKTSRQMGVLYDMVIESLSVRLRPHLKKDHIIRKALQLRHKYSTILQMLEDGRTLTPKEDTLLRTGNQIWGTKIKKRQLKKKTGEKKDTGMVVDKVKEDNKGNTISSKSRPNHPGMAEDKVKEDNKGNIISSKSCPSHPGIVVDKVKEDNKGNIISSKSCPSHHISNKDMEVDNDIPGAVNICDSDKAVDDSNILEFLTQMLVLSGNHGLGYSRSYLQNKMLLLESAKMKDLEDICNKLQEEERERNSRRVKASLKIIKIFESIPSSSL